MPPHQRNDLRRSAPALLAVAALLGGCAGGSSAKPLAEESIATQARSLRENLVSIRAIEQAPAGSPRRAFLDYWRSVQFADVDSAVEVYEPRLRREIGTELLALALRNASDVYRTQVPRIEETTMRGDTGVVRYLATTQASGTKVVSLSTTWQRTNGRWRIRYSSALDGELRIAAQTRVQTNIKPGSERLDPRAIRAGERAAALQARYLESLGRSRARR